VRTQGRKNSHQRVTAYKVSTSSDGSTWTEVDGGKVFDANIANSNTVVATRFSEPVAARYVRIIVESWLNHVSMRAALDVCSSETVSATDPPTRAPTRAPTRHPAAASCFAGKTLVMLANGSFKPIHSISVGTQLLGGARVIGTWKHHVRETHRTASILGVTLTPDHPVFHDGAWSLASNISTLEGQRLEVVYNLALDVPSSITVCASEDARPFIAATLGQQLEDLPHQFWGTSKVIDWMRAHPHWPELSTQPELFDTEFWL